MWGGRGTEGRNSCTWQLPNRSWVQAEEESGASGRPQEWEILSGGLNSVSPKSWALLGHSFAEGEAGQPSGRTAPAHDAAKSISNANEDLISFLQLLGVPSGGTSGSRPRFGCTCAILPCRQLPVRPLRWASMGHMVPPDVADVSW